ncbi:MAG: hypothetical protein H6600_06990 [Flavobacteriales bacterium]|nr:hypothetical protein [Flavobacteriales bacterium]
MALRIVILLLLGIPLSRQFFAQDECDCGKIESQYIEVFDEFNLDTLNGVQYFSKDYRNQWINKKRKAVKYGRLPKSIIRSFRKHAKKSNLKNINCIVDLVRDSIEYKYNIDEFFEINKIELNFIYEQVIDKCPDLSIQKPKSQ